MIENGREHGLFVYMQVKQENLKGLDRANGNRLGPMHDGDKVD